jgi:hypothetical protein
MIRTLSAIAAITIVACFGSPLPAAASIDSAKDVSVMPPSTAFAIGRALRDQLQPCANRHSSPGHGAERIRVIMQLELKRDGSLAAPPRIVGHDGLDRVNERYLGDVERAAVATVTECQPFRALPPEWYDGPQGWRQISIKYKLPG